MEEKSIKTKVCTRCGRELPIEMYYTAKTTADGYRCECKDCQREYMREYGKRKREARDNAKLAEETRSALPKSQSEEVIMEYLATVPPRYMMKALYKKGYRGNLKIVEVHDINLDHLFANEK